MMKLRHREIKRCAQDYIAEVVYHACYENTGTLPVFSF